MLHNFYDQGIKYEFTQSPHAAIQSFKICKLILLATGHLDCAWSWVSQGQCVVWPKGPTNLAWPGRGLWQMLGEKKNASFTAWCAGSLLRLNYLNIPHETIHLKLHLHLLFTRVFMLLTTISGSNYILTYAHKSTLNIQVTQTSWLSDINFTVFILQIIHL